MAPITTPRPTAPVERADRGVTDSKVGPPSAVILLYHRVADLPTDPQMLAVSPARFREQLDALTRECRVLTLAGLVEGLSTGRVPPRSVVLTFDDGYEDNLVQAAPVLRERGASATVFVASGYVTDPREFWWDELERRLLLPGALPRTLSLRVGEVTRSWDLGDAAAYAEIDFERHRGWNVTHRCNPTPRHRAYRELFDWLRPMTSRDRDDALAAFDVAWRCSGGKFTGEQVARGTHADSGAKERPPSRVGNAHPTQLAAFDVAWRCRGGKFTGEQVASGTHADSGAKERPPSRVGNAHPTQLAAFDVAWRCSGGKFTGELVASGTHADSGAKERPPSRVGNAHPTHGPLTPEQLCELVADGLIEIGAHTVNHPVLSALSVVEQRAEIARSKADLEAVLDKPVMSFSYPFGTRRDYTVETVDLVRRVGFSRACSNFAGRVTAASDPFQLPRVLVRDWDADTLLRRIEEVSRVA